MGLLDNLVEEGEHRRGAERRKAETLARVIDQMNGRLSDATVLAARELGWQRRFLVISLIVLVALGSTLALLHRVPSQSWISVSNMSAVAPRKTLLQALQFQSLVPFSEGRSEFSCETSLPGDCPKWLPAAQGAHAAKTLREILEPLAGTSIMIMVETGHDRRSLIPNVETMDNSMLAEQRLSKVREMILEASGGHAPPIVSLPHAATTMDQSEYANDRKATLTIVVADQGEAP